MSSDQLPPEDAAQALASAQVIGRVIDGKYRVRRLLGLGGMGSVYEAENSWTQRRVALKLLHPQFSAQPQFVQRFLREARSAAQVGHPHIVDVLDMGQDAEDGTLYIVQEFLVGITLRELLRTRLSLPLDETLEMILPVMTALVACHAQGVVHRDIKPENIFLLRRPAGSYLPKLIDFGLVKVTDAHAPATTQHGELVGTVAYMSPEQLGGDPSIDARTDVWAVGVLLYEMLSGRRPFPNARDPVAFGVSLQQPVQPLDRLVPEVPAALAGVVARALRYRRDERHESMRAFLEEVLASGDLDPYMLRGLKERHRDLLVASLGAASTADLDGATVVERMSSSPGEAQVEVRLEIPPSLAHAVTLSAASQAGDGETPTVMGESLGDATEANASHEAGPGTTGEQPLLFEPTRPHARLPLALASTARLPAEPDPPGGEPPLPGAPGDAHGSLGDGTAVDVIAQISGPSGEPVDEAFTLPIQRPDWSADDPTLKPSSAATGTDTDTDTAPLEPTAPRVRSHRVPTRALWAVALGMAAVTTAFVVATRLSSGPVVVRPRPPAGQIAAPPPATPVPAAAPAATPDVPARDAAPLRDGRAAEPVPEREGAAGGEPPAQDERP